MSATIGPSLSSYNAQSAINSDQVQAGIGFRAPLSPRSSEKRVVHQQAQGERDAKRQRSNMANNLIENQRANVLNQKPPLPASYNLPVPPIQPTSLAHVKHTAFAAPPMPPLSPAPAQRPPVLPPAPPIVAVEAAQTSVPDTHKPSSSDQQALPCPVNIDLGDLKNFSPPPNEKFLNSLNGRRPLDKLKSYIATLCQEFKDAFPTYIGHMEKGEGIELTQVDLQTIMADLQSGSPKGFLNIFSTYAHFFDQWEMTGSKCRATSPTIACEKSILDISGHGGCDPTWGGFTLEPTTLTKELPHILGHIGAHPDFPSNTTIQFSEAEAAEKTDEESTPRFCYLRYETEPFNPSTLALSAKTQSQLEMKTEVPLPTIRLLNDESDCIMSGQRTPNGTFLLHTIDTKGTAFNSSEMIDLATKIAKSMGASSMLLYDAAKIYLKDGNEDDFYFYTKAQWPLKTKPPFYGAPSRGDFRYYERPTAVLDQGGISTFDGITSTKRRQIISDGFDTVTMGDFLSLTNPRQHTAIDKHMPLLTYWTSVLTNYLSTRNKNAFKPLHIFLNALASIKDIPKTHPKYSHYQPLINAVERWAQPEFYCKDLSD